MKNRRLLLLVCGVLCLGMIGCNAAEDKKEADNAGTQPVQVTQQAQEVTGVSEEEFFVSRMDERARTNTISAEMKEKATQMEAVSYQKLPKWYGTSPNSKYECGWVCEGLTSQFTEQTVEEMAGEGFNFIRVPIDTRIFYLEEIAPSDVGPHFKGNSDNVNLKELENLDALISWCIKYNIHVCLDVHNTPGGYMIGGDEEASRELLFTEGSAEEQMFFDFWDMVSVRYADVSTNALSFNLYNEPPRFLEEEQYVRFVKRGIEVIHGYTPERLIFVDMLDYAHVPVESLVGEPVVQTFHFYEPTSFSHANFSLETGTNRSDPILVSYPMPAISCELREEDSYTICGEFPAGSELHMYFGMGNVGGELSVKADGKEIYRQKITEELVNKGGLDVTYDEYGTGVFNCYETGRSEMKLVCPVTEPAKTIEFCYQHENPALVWLELNNLVVETPNYRTGLSAMWIEGVQLPVTDAMIDGSGRVTLTQDLSQYEQGYQLIEDSLKQYYEFSERTGVQVMLQEFGAMSTNDVRCTAEYFDDILSVCEKYGFSWSMWNYDGGDFSYVMLDDIFRRTGATYEEVGEGRYIPLELREVFQKHMKSQGEGLAKPTNQPTEEPTKDVTPADTSTVAPTVTQEQPVPVDLTKYYDMIDSRVKKIQNSETTIEPVGTVFYVSSSMGDDNNDGLTPETAWKTCKRVNEDYTRAIYESVEKNGGATVLFKRGDVWVRDGIQLWYPNMIYSTYGEGEKPVFDYSLENAANPEYWTLMEGTDNIWVYYKEVPFLGSITLNDTYSADNREGFYWDGVWYQACFGSDHWNPEGRVCHYENGDLYDVTALPNETFFVDVRPGNEWLDEGSGQLHVYSCEDTGILYYSCCAGNPGEVYEKMDLCSGFGMSCGSNCTYDNLVVRNTGNQAVSNMVDDNSIGCTMQNCEVYFCGDQYINFDPESHMGYVGGECGGFHGPGSRYYNNYFYGSREGGFTVEIGWTGRVDGDNVTLGDVIAEGNVFERCDGGIGVICFLESADGVDMSEVVLQDNYFLDIGVAHDEGGNDPVVLGTIHIWDNSGDVDISGFSIRNNLFMFSHSRTINLEQVTNASFIETSGNTVILRKGVGMNGVRQTNDDIGERYYNTTEEIQGVLGEFGELIWVE